MRAARCFVVTAALAFFGMAFGHASGASASVCEQMKLHKKAPIPFRAFEMKNPQTGEKYLPNEEIEVSRGKKMLARDFFGQLNDLEQRLNQWGYSLRDGGTVTLQELDQCLVLLQKQKELIAKDIDEKGPPAWSPEKHAAELAAAWEKYKSNLPSWETLWRKANDADVKVYLPDVPPFSAPAPRVRRAELKPIFKEKAWSFEIGEKSKFWVNARASLGVRGTKTQAKANARGAVNGAVLGAWEGEILSASANAETLGSDEGALGIDVKAVGNTVFSKTWRQAGLKQEEAKQFDAKAEADFRFALGPIPMRARVGFRGAVGLRYAYQIVPLRVDAYAVPFAKADAYAQVGADVGIVGGGIGGQLTLVADYVTLQGSVQVALEDEPTLAVELNGTNSIEALSGSIYAYAYVDLWIKRFEGRWDIWKWEGFKKQGSLFRYEWVWTPSGVTAQGDLTAEDVMEVDAARAELRLSAVENESARHVYEVMSAVSADLTGPAAAAVGTEQRRQAVLSSGVDDVIRKYGSELKQWIES